MTDTTTQDNGVQPEDPQLPFAAEVPQERIDAVEAREDAVLMELDGADEDAPAPEPVAEEPAAETGQPEAAQPEQETGDNIDTDEIAEAWSVLRRDGFSKDDLGALSDEAVLRLAAHRKKVQGDVDRMLSESKAKSTEAEEQIQAEPVEPNTAEASTGQPVADNLREAAKVFADYAGLDDEGTDLLAKSYAAVMAPLQQQLQGLQNFIAGQQIEAARVRLADRYPQVADTSSDDWNKVVDRMNKLYAADSHNDIGALMEDAIAFEFRDQLRGEAESATQTIRNLRNNGTPAAAQGERLEQAPLSGEDVEDRVLALLESDDPDRIAKARALTGR